MAKDKFLQKLKKRWQLESVFQVLVVLLVFALTGFTVMFLKKPLLELMGDGVNDSIWFSILYYILILPVYQLILLVYAFLFGQFKFFWAFEKRTFARIKNAFLRNSS